MVENEQPFMPVFVEKFVDPEYAFDLHSGEGRQ